MSKHGRMNQPLTAPIDRIDLAREMVKILEETIEVPIRGVPTQITCAEALARRTLIDAMEGKASARRDVIELARIAAAQIEQEQDIVIEARLVLEDGPQPVRPWGSSTEDDSGSR
jgi:hypothetical protein